MDVPTLIAQLSKLQLEQNSIIEQLAKIPDDTAAETKDKNPTAAETDTEIRVGDHVSLLTGGIRCAKGNRARVTKVTESSVYFTILRNQHNTYKKHKNVRKIQEI